MVFTSCRKSWFTGPCRIRNIFNISKDKRLKNDVIGKMTSSVKWRSSVTWWKYQVNINYFLQNFGYGRDYIYSSADSALNQYANLSQRKELADYDDLWNGYNFIFSATWTILKNIYFDNEKILFENFYIRNSLYLLLPRSELLKSLFAIYDRNQTYCFTFRDFLYIRATRAAPALEKLNISKLFKVKNVSKIEKKSEIFESMFLGAKSGPLIGATRTSRGLGNLIGRERHPTSISLKAFLNFQILIAILSVLTAMTMENYLLKTFQTAWKNILVAMRKVSRYRDIQLFVLKIFILVVDWPLGDP